MDYLKPSFNSRPANDAFRTGYDAIDWGKGKARTYEATCTKCGAPMKIVSEKGPPWPYPLECSKHVGEGTTGPESW